MGVSVEVIGMDKLIKNLDKYIKVKTEEMHGVIAQGAEAVKFEAKMRVPVDTGKLRSSITYTLIERKFTFTGRVIADTHYAAYVEYGTRKMRAQPYMYPAYQRGVATVIDGTRKVFST